MSDDIGKCPLCGGECESAGYFDFEGESVEFVVCPECQHKYEGFMSLHAALSALGERCRKAERASTALKEGVHIMNVRLEVQERMSGHATKTATERAEKADAEVERLRVLLQEADGKVQVLTANEPKSVKCAVHGCNKAAVHFGFCYEHREHYPRTLVKCWRS